MLKNVFIAVTSGQKTQIVPSLMRFFTLVGRSGFDPTKNVRILSWKVSPGTNSLAHLCSKDKNKFLYEVPMPFFLFLTDVREK
jgi:hypothetical protein